jgi:SNF2 family DNA or RNA helicase
MPNANGCGLRSRTCGSVLRVETPLLQGTVDTSYGPMFAQLSATTEGWQFRYKLLQGIASGITDGAFPTVWYPRIAAAAEWCSELDAARESRLLDGAEISVWIPAVTTHSTRVIKSPQEALVARSAAAELARPLLLPEPSEAHLLGFQASGVDWLVSGSARILADDMGLGKTVQAIAALRRLVALGQARNCLVVAPKSLAANWTHELARWAPELIVLRVVPGAAHRDEVWDLLLRRAHVLITNYEQLRTPSTILQNERVSVFIADEVHRARNVESQITQGMKLVGRDRFWGLSGTPVERDASDLATLLSIAEPSRFSADDARLPVAFLREVARPFVLRRDKQTVLKELPEVLESTEVLELGASQRESYVSAARPWMRGSLAPPEAVVTLNKLMAICCLDPESGESSKLDRIEEIVDAVAGASEKIVVFSYLLDPLYSLRRRLEKRHQIAFLEGAMSPAERDAAVRRFRSSSDVVALLASLRVGGEGLTLTEANHVAFVNEWWNPSANAQARDRVVRIGQKRGVVVYRFVCTGTVEEALGRILARKEAGFQALVGCLSTEGHFSSEVTPAVSDLLRNEMAGMAEP